MKKMMTYNNGSEHGLAKLTEDEVRHIRECYRKRQHLLDEAAKFSISNLAEVFGVAHGTVHDIVQYRTWRHVRSDDEGG